jgi:hypothetical protein
MKPQDKTQGRLFVPDDYTGDAKLAVPMATAADADPVTSDMAAARIEASGHATAQRRAVLAAVLAHPGSTSAELARIAGMDRHAAARRLPEVRKAGLVRNPGRRTCSVAGILAVTWEAVA